ncbi:cytochrome P450 [Collybia nuda]|uniref:Cytochrome P450 n=1 Tax=Collybia nuda TaxID=64659 RepID=A0A9P5XU96_9AGAR|nr:cytochrome P450 [Collybia nuda]
MSKRDLFASAASFSILIYLYVKSRNRANLGLPLPPGPKKLPLIGNLLDMPSSLEWETYHKWCEEHNSDIIHLDVAGTSIVVLDTSEAVTELLERRSSLYSGRARLPMINELMGWDFNFGFMPYGDHWRRHRRLMHQNFHPSAATRFRPHELKATHNLLQRLLDDPGVDGLIGHLRHMAGGTIISIAYGIEVLPENDPYIEGAESAIKPLVTAGVPGTFLVDAFPFLKYVPDWFPFAGFKRKAKEWRELSQAMVEVPFKVAKQKIMDGDSIPSFTSYCLEKMDDNGDLAYQESVIRSTAGTMYAAASDTTVSAIASCILGLMTNPHILKKAQQEIDGVVGYGKLPDFDDEHSLPYITAIIKEALRWRDVVPIAIPHLASVEDEYKGYRIPAGSIVIPNAWAMLHNESVYPDPFTFNPDRFMKDGKLNPAVRDPDHAAFGFGRRACPGRYMAISAIWITIASIIAAFDITKPIDEKGQVIEPSHEYISELVCMPLPFKCTLKPRSKEVEKAIRTTSLL